MQNFNPSFFTTVINSYLPEPHASLLNGILFGVDLHTSKAFYESLKVVGLLHIVVLSGINITMLALIIYITTSFFGRYISSLITILSLILFVIFVGAKAPIVRAAIMGILTFVAFTTGKRKQIFFALFLSLIFIFMFWPDWIRTISLQLSYAATIGIILFGPKRQSENENFFIKTYNDIKNEFKLSLSAQIITAPIIFLYFKQISIISPLSNVLISPLIAPLMIFGFITAILGKINYSLGLIPAYICFGLLSYIIFIIQTLSKIPFVFFRF